MRKISRDELIEMCSKGRKFTLVDVLGRDSYEKEHIPGALSIPLDDLEQEAERFLDKNDTIVVYCASFVCTASTTAAQKLEEMGYKKVLDYKGGLKDYKEAGLSLQGSLHEHRSCASCCACH
jgi:rhodanese-related sulfurtransferase